jgi:hypothetical protein
MGVRSAFGHQRFAGVVQNPHDDEGYFLQIVAAIATSRKEATSSSARSPTTVVTVAVAIRLVRSLPRADQTHRNTRQRLPLTESERALTGACEHEQLADSQPAL